MECLKWISSFLSDRCQTIRTNDTKEQAPLQTITGGTPQGSCLSPILFALVMSSLHTLSSQSAIVKYADDITLISWHSKSEDNNIILQNEVTHIEQWCAMHGLCINPSKTSLLHFKGKKNPRIPSPHIGNTIISAHTEAKILGVVLQDNLKWNKQVEISVTKASKTLFPLLQLKRSGANKSVLQQFYASCTQSIITYSYPCMCNMGENLKKLIDKVERRARILMGCSALKTWRQVSNCACLRLHSQVLSQKDHPLRQLLLNRKVTRVTRSHSSAIVPSVRSSMSANSFLKYFM